MMLPMSPPWEMPLSDDVRCCKGWCPVDRVAASPGPAQSHSGRLLSHGHYEMELPCRRMRRAQAFHPGSRLLYCVAYLLYTWRSARIEINRAAPHAGEIPEHNPTAVANPNDTIIH